MKKIRINELARELEVKAHEILDRLPELGVTEKKTHSSSIDEDVAIKLRQYYGQDVPDYVHDPNADDSTSEGHDEAHARGRARSSAPPSRSHRSHRCTPAARTAACRRTRAGPEEEKPAAEEAPRPMRADPPAAGGPPDSSAGRCARACRPEGPRATPAPPAPHVPHARAPGSRAAVAARAAPAAPATQTPPAAAVRARAVRSPRPPSRCPPRRAPARCFPARASRSLQSPAPGAPQQRPQVDSAPRAAARPRRRKRRAPVGPGAPAMPCAPQQRPLAGQPAARPVVPPRPDLVAKLSAPRPGDAAAAGAAASRHSQGAQRSRFPASRFIADPSVPASPWWPSPACVRACRRAASRRSAPAASHFARRAWSPVWRRRPRSSRRAGVPASAAPSASSASASRKRRFCGRRRRQVESGPPPINREITISEGITVKELSEKLDVKANLVMKKLMDRGIFATINQTLDAKLATEIARDFGASTATVSYEDEAMQAVEEAEDTKDQVQPRARGHHHGPRRSRQDVAARRHPRSQRGGPRSRRHHPAHRRLPRGDERPQDRLHRHARPRSLHPHACPRRQGHRHRRAGGGGRRRRHAADPRSHRPRPRGQGADHRGDQQDRQARRAAGAHQAAARRPRPAGRRLGRRHRHGAGFGAHAGQTSRPAARNDPAGGRHAGSQGQPGRPAMGTVHRSQARPRPRSGGHRAGAQRHAARGRFLHLRRGIRQGARHARTIAAQQIRKAEPSTPVEVLGLDSLPEAGDDFQVVTDTAKAKQIVNLPRSQGARRHRAGQDPAASPSSSCTSR